jgi:hypothetical protein
VIALFLSCIAPPTGQEIIELVAMLDSGTVMEARFTAGDTGILRGQGSFVFHHWLPDQTSLSHGYKGLPAETGISPTLSQIGLHSLSLEEGSLRLQSEEFQARAVLFGGRKPKQATAEDSGRGLSTELLWAGAQLSGWCSIERRSSPLVGSATILHRKQRLAESGQRSLLLAQSTDFEMGIDCNDGLCLAWGWRDGVPLDTQNPSLSIKSSGAELRAGKFELDFVPSRQLGEEDPHEHLLGFERILALPWTRLDLRRIFTGSAMLKEGNSSQRASVILIHRGSGPPKVVAAGKGKPREDKR